MKYSIKATISSDTAAKLVLSNEIDLSDTWTYDQSKEVLNSLLLFDIAEILDIIEWQDVSIIGSSEVPQFGSAEALAKVPQVLSSTGIQSLSYAQLGYYLKQDVNAKLEANIKFGENHGKGAALLGIAQCINGKISCSSLSAGFCKLHDAQIQNDVIMRLYFRIPIIQLILQNAKTSKYNGYEPIRFFTEITMKRRGQCLRRIFKHLSEIDNAELNRRLNNIYWEV